jgi:hypothetical protein
MLSFWKHLVWLALLAAMPGGPAAAYLEGHQGA